MIQLVIAWTCVGIFAATGVLTLLAVAGVIKLADRKYTDRLFKVLVVELVAICLGIFTGTIELPGTVEQRCVSKGEGIGREAAVAQIKPELDRLVREAKAREQILRKKAQGVTITAAEKAELAKPISFDAKLLSSAKRVGAQR